MKILCVCDYYITESLQVKFKELEKYGAEVVIINDEMLCANREAAMDVMFQTESGGAGSVRCSEQVIEAAKDADILIVHVTPVNQELIDACTNLKLVAAMRGGLDSVDVEYLRKKEIITVHAPSRSAHAVADFTLGMILSEVNNIARSHHTLMEGKWQKEFSNSENVHDLRTRTVGIIGCGYIGGLVIERLKAFGCSIIVHDPYLSESDLMAKGYSPVSKEYLLQNADIISLHLRLSDQTKEYIGAAEISMMKPTAVLVNTARAGLVNQEAMVAALESKRISGAAVDVFDSEPLPHSNPYRQLENITMTAHIAGTSCDTFVNSVELIYDEVKRYLKHEELIWIAK